MGNKPFEVISQSRNILSNFRLTFLTIRYSEIHFLTLPQDNYRMSARYVPKKPPTGEIELFFYYKEMKETVIEQAAAYHFSTLFANFGGTLGLMTGGLKQRNFQNLTLHPPHPLNHGVNFSLNQF